LLLNGVGHYYRFIFSVYQVQLFLEQPSSKPEMILSSKEIKFARMVFMRSVSAKTIQASWLEDFEKQCALLCEKLAPQLQQLLAHIPDMKSGDYFEFLFLPHELRIRKEGTQEIRIEGDEFSHYLLSSWLGPMAPSPGFRRGILGLDRKSDS
jgi:hypothetical protein